MGDDNYSVYCLISTEAEESMGKFGAALGSGAAKFGKKAAQSEAGRSAGRAAITGATDGVKEDLTNRYFGPGGGGSRESSPAPASAPATPTPTPTKPSTPSTSSPSLQHQRTAAPPPSSRSESRPPKPSILTRFKPHINKPPRGQGQTPVRQTSRKERIYKYNLSKEANWEDKMRVQTLFNYKSDQRSELEFRRGQVIQVLTRTDSQFDWWEGKLEERVGIFPANYVKVLRD